MAEYRAIRVEKGNGGFGGPLVIQGTEKKNKVMYITGGGIEGNLCRVIPDGLSANIDLSKIRILPVFRFIKEKGNIKDAEMLSTFNMGVGLILVVPEKHKKKVIGHISKYHDCYEIGSVSKGNKKIVFKKRLNWI